jgi:hypothetical protein
MLYLKHLYGDRLLVVPHPSTLSVFGEIDSHTLFAYCQATPGIFFGRNNDGEVRVSDMPVTYCARVDWLDAVVAHNPVKETRTHALPGTFPRPTPGRTASRRS